MFKNDFSKYSKNLDTYFKEITHIRVLSPNEERELTQRIQQGDEEALNTLIKHNLRFVVNTAKAYRNPNIPFSDLISEGNLGLIHAAKRFDPQRGNRFITYAVFWIRSFIIDYIKSWSGIVDEEVTDNMIEQYNNKMGNDITEKELSSNQERETAVSELLNCLQEREKQILIMFYGLDGNDEMTLDEVGTQLNITQERVRQIKDNAISKLKCEALSFDDEHFQLMADMR